MERTHLDEALIDFVHDGSHSIELEGLTKAERKWAHLRCDLFHLQHESINKSEGRVLVISKGNHWVYKADKPIAPIEWSTGQTRSGKRSGRIKLYECDNCGEVSVDPELLRYYHKDLDMRICEDCRYGEFEDM